MKKIISRALLALILFIILACSALIMFFPGTRITDILVNKWRKSRDLVLSRIEGMRHTVGFDVAKLEVPGLQRPTSLQFGPDGMLYVASMNGVIFRLDLSVDASGTYHIDSMDSIRIINTIPNHDDDGTVNPRVHTRQITGLLVTGTATRPVIYVSSSDPRMTGDWDVAGKSEDGDLNLDTNSGIVSMLEWDGVQWRKTDLVRGLPRSEENHAVNGLAIDPQGKFLYLACGGNTNAGSPSRYFGFLGDYALSAALLRIDLDRLHKMPLAGGDSDRHVFDLPTLNDPTRTDDASGADTGDPFGGNDGLNQAKWDPQGPVTIAAAGFRNPYDILVSGAHPGFMYTIDNGADEGIGGFPVNMGLPTVSNAFDSNGTGGKKGGLFERFVMNHNSLHAIPIAAGGEMYYGGHPVPIRANPLGAGWYWRDATAHFESSPTKDWPPVPASAADKRQSEYRVVGTRNTGIAVYDYSTNGFAEYRSSAFFEGSLRGDIISASFDGSIIRTHLNEAGDHVLFSRVIAKGFGLIPLDLTCQGDLDPFPGTIWVADWGANCLHVLTPKHANTSWTVQPNLDGSAPQARHECSFAEADGRLFLMGGRGVKAMDVYDPGTGHWSKGPLLPDSMELNHAQAVSLGGKIYLGCGLTGPFPEERPVPDLFIFDPVKGAWDVKKAIVPEDRRRGSSGAVAHEGKIYFIGGTTHGHAKGSVPWTDVYDTLTGAWTRLKDAPHARDHFQAAIVDGKIYAVGGRRSNQAQGRTFEDVETSVDVYDITSGEWSTLPPSANLPTARGGATTVVANGNILVIGGESKQPIAHDQVEAFDVKAGRWSAWPSLRTGRHGTQAVVKGNTLVIVAGCGQQGGSPELNTMETFVLPARK